MKIKEEVSMKEKVTKNKAMLRRAIGLLLCFAVVAVFLPVHVAKASSTKASAIDTSKTGSITIHKYEYTDASQIAGLPASNGEELTISTSGDFKALKEVGFTLYKVKNVTIEDYYNGDTSTTLLPDIKTNSAYYYTKDAQGKITVNSTNIENATYKDSTTVTQIKTDANGKATFNNLPLGIYLVVETETPVSVTTPVEPFLVSVPMTKSSNNQEWLYDIHAYPKNKTAYGELNIEKTGNTSAKLEGVVFRLQRSNGTTWEEVEDSANSKTYTELTTDDQGSISISGLPHGTYRLIETSIGTNAGYIVDGKTAYQFRIADDGKVYDVTGDVFGSPTESENTAKKIIIDNEKPDIEKQVLKKDTTNDFVKEADYSVGDIIKYQSTFDVPEKVADLETFKIKDEPINIKVDTSSIVIKDGSNTVPTTVYTVTQGTGENGFTIDFKTGTGIEAYKGKKLTLTYSAKLENAPTTIIVGNTNTIKLDYSDIIKADSADTTNPNKDITVTTSEITDTTTVFSFELKIIKTDDEGNPLEGVEFDLYKEVTAGTTGAITGDAAKALGLASGSSWLKINTAALETAASTGVVSQDGLSNGTYYLVETKTVEGYNLLSKPVEVTLGVSYTVTRKTDMYKNTGTLPSGISTQWIKSEVTATEFKDGATILTGTIGEDVNIKNSKGFTLPQTGGAGGFLFTLIGCIIMIVGIVIFHKTRKKTV